MNKNRWWTWLASHLTAAAQEHPALSQWTVRCQDQHGRSAWLVVSATKAGVVLTPSVPGPLRLPGLAVGRLRGTLRAAAIRVELQLAEPATQLHWHVDPHVPPTDLVA